MNTYDTETIDGFNVRYVYDTDADMPWENSEGHGPVRKTRTPHWHRYSGKKPGERPLNKPDRGEYQYYYDWQAATKAARVDGWNTVLYDAPNRVQRAVQADFDFLRGYLREDWCYVGVVIEDKDGNELDSVFGVETFKDYHREHAREMVATLKASQTEEATERDYWACRDVATV